MLTRCIVVLGLSAAGLICGSCSVLLDAEGQQCSTDADCAARGLSGSVCVANLCQAASSMAIGTAGNPGGSMPVAGDPARSSDAGNPPMSSTSMSGSGAQTLPPTRGPGADETPSGAAGSSGVATGDGGSATSMSCAQGRECCSVHDDCELAGIPGGICVDSICWPLSEQCSSDMECTARGAEFEGGRCLGSRCLANPRWRCELPPPVAATGEKELTVLLRDSLSLSPIPDVHIVACAKLDPECANPITEGTTGSDGILAIKVRDNFAGYLQQTDRTDYAPALYFLPPVFPKDGVLQPFPLLGAGASLDALAATLGSRIDPMRGNMMLIAEDCMGMALPGATFSSPQADENTVQFYVRDLLPSTAATETADAGNGGYLNMPPGTVVLNLARAMPPLDLATISVSVRAGFISIAYVRPQSR
jgi:hypothetical protein